MARISAKFLAYLMIPWLAIAPGAAQTASWDYKGRERSQEATSAGVTALTKGQVDQAITSLLRATGADPNDPLPYAILGLALDMKGRFAEAIDALHKSYRLAPKLGETALSIGVTHYLTRDYQKAINAWQKALEINPNLCHIHGDLGYAYMRKGEPERATDEFKKLINCYPNSQFAYQGLATVRYLSGDFPGAREAAEHAQSISPYPPVLLLLAKLDVLQGDRARADKRIQEYIKLTSKPWQQRSMTAIGYSIQHDFRWDPYLVDSFDNAYLLWARIVNLPKEAGRQRQLAAKGKAADAISRAQTALATGPGDFWVLRELGLLELASGQYSDAVEHFKEVMRQCPTCYVDLLHLGRALSLEGRSAEASAYVRKFQRRFPSARLSPLFSEIARVDPGISEEDISPGTAQVKTAAPEPGF